MATPKKPSNRAKSGSSRSGSTPKKPATKRGSGSSAKPTRKAPAKRSSSAAGGKIPAKRTTSRSTRKAPVKATRKTAPKSGSKAQARAAAAAVPEIEEPARTAAAAKAEGTAPSLRPGRRRSYGRWVAVAGLLAAVVLVVVLIASGGSGDNNAIVADTTPATTPTAPAETATATEPAVTTPSAATPSGATPAARIVVRSSNCDPIIGSGTANGGKTYDVTSTAKDGDPAGCGEAHSVLLSALQGGGTTIGDWTCKTNPSGSVIASCTSSTGGRSIKATS